MCLRNFITLLLGFVILLSTIFQSSLAVLPEMPTACASTVPEVLVEDGRSERIALVYFAASPQSITQPTAQLPALIGDITTPNSLYSLAVSIKKTTNSFGQTGHANTSPGALLDVGLAGATLGTMRLEGSTSGYVQLQTNVAAGSWTLTLPTSGGTNGYVLQTDGTGISSWVAAGTGATITLGTSASVTNPQRSGDATTGLFSPAVGTVAIASGSAEEMRVNSTGVGIGTTTVAAALDVATNGAASTPGERIEGTWYTGGNTTTNKPGLLVEPNGTTSTNWSANGTGLGVNAASGFTGNLIDAQIAASSKFKVDSTGNISTPNIVVSSGGDSQEFNVTNTVNDHPDIYMGFGSFTSEQGMTMFANNGALTAGGSFATERLMRFVKLTIGGAATTKTITNGISVAVDDAPAVSGTAVISNAYGLDVGRAGTTLANAAGTVYSSINVPAHTVTLANTTHVTSTVGAAGLTLGQITVGQSGGAVTMDSAASLYIANAPTAGASVTLTNPYAIYVAAGNSYFAGAVTIGSTTPVAGGGLTIAPSAVSSGSPSLLTVSGPADTTLTASTEATDVNINLARTVQFATGAIGTQRAMRIQAPTYSFVGASTITNAATVDISGPPVAGTNATITNPAALVVESGNVGIVFTTPDSDTLNAAVSHALKSDVLMSRQDTETVVKSYGSRAA